jgi:type VI secretion system protein ImpH
MATASGDTSTVVAINRHREDALPFGELTDAEWKENFQFEKIRKMFNEEVFRVEFFQAVRLLQRMEKNRGAVGYFVAPDREAIRFSSLPSLSFPPSQLYDLKRDEHGQLQLVVQFMGLNAAISILPHAYTEYLLARLRDKDTAMADFFDIFNHRLISLFYRGWQKYRFYIGYENGDQDTLTPRMLDFIGLGTQGLQNQSTLPDQAFLSYAGLLGKHVRTAGALKQILEDYFGVPVTIHQFAGAWRSLPANNQSSLSGFNRASERLGVGTVVGNEVWDHHGRIRISIGPMSFDEYVSFLPGYDAHRDLEAWVRFYSNGQYEAEVQLILKKEEAPACELGTRGKQEPRLGLASWLKTKPLRKDPGDAIFLLT